MVHIKITCDECGADYETDCKGLLLFIIDPKDKTTPGVFTAMHHVALREVIGSIWRWISEQVIYEMQQGESAGNAERLLNQIKDIDEKLKGL